MERAAVGSRKIHRVNFLHHVKGFSEGRCFTMFCKNCDTKMPDHAKFCSNCGAGLSGSMQEATPVTIASTQPINISTSLEHNIPAFSVPATTQVAKDLPAILDRRFTILGTYQVKLTHAAAVKRTLRHVLSLDKKKLM